VFNEAINLIRRQKNTSLSWHQWTRTTSTVMRWPIAQHAEQKDGQWMWSTGDDGRSICWQHVAASIIICLVRHCNKRPLLVYGTTAMVNEHAMAKF